MGNKLMIDNNRLKIYIDKIEQMQKLLNRYETQINSLNDELKQKNDKIRILLLKVKSPNTNNINEESDMVNLDVNNENELLSESSPKKYIKIEENENEKIIPLLKEKINEYENEIKDLKNKLENEKPDNINNNIDQNKQSEEKIEELNKENEENKLKIKDLEIKNEESNKIIKELNNQNDMLKNQINLINSQEISKHNNNIELENNIEETTSIVDDKVNKSNIMINDYNNIKSRYTEAENTINKLNIRIKELENDISILKTNRTKSESNEIIENNINNKENQNQGQIKELLDINENARK